MKKILTVAVIALGVFGIVVSSSEKVHAITSVEAEAIIRALDLTGNQANVIRALVTTNTQSSASFGPFTRQMGVGTRGEDVSALQNFLISRGYLGVNLATGYYGTLTQSAVSAFQRTNGITPTGYFGPLTLARVNSILSTVAGGGNPTSPTTPVNPTTPTGTGGGTSNNRSEGYLTNIEATGGITSSFDEGENEVEILGISMEARDSDITLERVEIDFEVDSANSGGSSRLNRYIDSISLVLDGKTLASQDVDEGDRNGSTYSFRFSNLRNAVIDEGDEVTLYVVVDAVNSIDSDDENTDIVVTIPQNGIRASDEVGIYDTYVSTSESEDLTQTFSVGSESTGNVSITENSSSPAEGIITVDSDDSTEDVTLLTFNIRARNSDLEVNSIPVRIETFSSTGDEEDAPSVRDVIDSIQLVEGTNVIKSRTLPNNDDSSATIVFDNLNDLTIEEGNTLVLKINVDISRLDENYLEGTGVRVSIDDEDEGWDIETVDGDVIDPSGSAMGEIQTLYENGISVEVDESRTEVVNVVSADPQVSGSADVKTFELGFTIRAINEDVYIDKDIQYASSIDDMNPGDGIAWSFTEDSAEEAEYEGARFTASGSTRNDTDTAFRVGAGQERDFLLSVTLSATGSGYEGIQINGINWSIDMDETEPENFFTFNLDDVQVDPIFMRVTP